MAVTAVMTRSPAHLCCSGSGLSRKLMLMMVGMIAAIMSKPPNGSCQESGATKHTQICYDPHHKDSSKEPLLMKTPKYFQQHYCLEGLAGQGSLQSHGRRAAVGTGGGQGSSRANITEVDGAQSLDGSQRSNCLSVNLGRKIHSRCGF